MKMLQLYKASAVLEEVVSSYITREMQNTATYGNWKTEEGLYLDLGLFSEKPHFISWDSLEIWADKYFAST